MSRTVNGRRTAPDTTPPVITLTGPAAVTITVGASYADEGATCTDDTDTNPTLSTDNPVDTATAATYTVTYSCEDDAGNHATEVTRAVIVQEAADTTPPTFVSSELDIDAGVLTITFSETIDAANIVPAKMHIRESGNYTHGTTLTAGELDTDGATVSFALTPSHRAAVAGLAAPELTIEPGAVRDESGNLIVGTFDASTRTFVDATSIQAQETQPRDIAFSNDGTKMFIVGDVKDNVNEYTLSTPFDASTLTFVDATSIRAQDHQPRGMAFSNDGTKMFVVGYLGDNVNEYTLSTPFDASTLTFVDATSIQAQEDDARSVAFSNDGTKMFVMGVVGDDVNEYALSTPFDASTLTFIDATPISSEEAFPTGMVFSNDGTKMFVIGWEEYVNEYALSTPFDASTLMFTDATSISSEESDSQGIAFSNDGAKMFIIGVVGDDVNEYELSSVYPVTVTRMPPTFVASELDIDAGVLTITFSETIDAANIVPAKIHVRETGNYTHGVTLTAGELGTDADGATVSFALTPSHLAAVAGLAAPELTIEPGAVRDESGNLIVGTFDASTRTFVDATSIRDHETQPRGMAFSNDGTKMFVIGGIIDSVKEYALSTPFDASTLTLTDATDISSQDGQPRGMAFSNYGTKMFVIDSGTDDVNEYALSTPFDASTLAFIDATGIDGQDTSPRGIAFSNDGTKMFMLGGDGDDVNEYDLSSPFDASTRSFVDATGIGGQDTSPRGIAFSNDGAKMFILGGDGDDVNEYDLSSPFDASTRSFVDATGIGGQDTSPRGIAFSNDGTKMFMLGGDGDDVNEYDLSAPFDASTRRFIDATSISEQETDPQGIAFSNDGAKMFVIGDAGDDVNEYDLHSVYPVTVTRTPPTFVSSVLDFDAGVLTITFSETIDAANVVPARMHVRETGNYTHGVTLSAGELDTAADGATISFTLTPSHLAAVAGLATPELTIEPGAVQDTSGNLIVDTFDASTRSFVDATSIRSQETLSTGIAFSNDGAKMFVIGTSGGDVNEYTLSTPFDASTRSFVDATSIRAQETFPTGIAFSNDGTKMFIVGAIEDNVNEYDLSTPFDASTRSFVDATPVLGFSLAPTGIAFSSDGTRMFVMDDTGNSVHEYDLSTPFDASTRSIVNAASIRLQETLPTDIAFSNDGTKMFVIGTSGDDVNEYTLSTPFDASTRSFVDATSIQEQETAPTGIAFSNDGTKMFVIGTSGDDVNEYDLHSVYPITVTGTYTVLPAGAFVTTWNATSSPHTISIPLEVRSGGTITIDWGDGSTDDVTASGTQSRAYSGPGDYRVSMAGDLSRINLGAAGATASKLASIDQWGDVEWSSMEGRVPVRYRHDVWRDGFAGPLRRVQYERNVQFCLQIRRRHLRLERLGRGRHELDVP